MIFRDNIMAAPVNSTYRQTSGDIYSIEVYAIEQTSGLTTAVAATL